MKELTKKNFKINLSRCTIQQLLDFAYEITQGNDCRNCRYCFLKYYKNHNNEHREIFEKYSNHADYYQLKRNFFKLCIDIFSINYQIDEVIEHNQNL